ncbi:MAG TPA: acyl carrier protein [Anaeromyxobacteraceae bacterium]|nr:acyl carrier protein [Anaeromyxobacteraceae bacterium]
MTPREAGIAAEILRVARTELQLEARIDEDEELASRLDSLALLSLVVAVEDRFRVILDDEDAAGTRTLSDLARLVARKLDETARQGAGSGAEDAGSAHGADGGAP